MPRGYVAAFRPVATDLGREPAISSSDDLAAAPGAVHWGTHRPRVGAVHFRPFVMYAAQGWVDLLTVQIKLLRGQAEILTWRALVDELFGERLSPAEHRQRLIAIAIAVASSAEPVPRAKIHVLTDALAEAYTTKGPKTVTRDLNRLVNLGLIASGPRGYRAQILLVRGMRPFAALNGSGAALIKGAA